MIMVDPLKNLKRNIMVRKFNHLKTFEAFNSSNNRIKLPENFINEITKAPESGMGYHIATIILNNGETLFNRTILNSDTLLLNDDEEIDPKDIKEIIIN